MKKKIMVVKQSQATLILIVVEITWITNRIVFNNEPILFYLSGKNKHSNYKFEGIYEIKSGVFILPSREQ